MVLINLLLDNVYLILLMLLNNVLKIIVGVGVRLEVVYYFFYHILIIIFFPFWFIFFLFKIFIYCFFIIFLIFFMVFLFFFILRLLKINLLNIFNTGFRAGVSIANQIILLIFDLIIIYFLIVYNFQFLSKLPGLLALCLEPCAVSISIFWQFIQALLLFL